MYEICNKFSISPTIMIEVKDISRAPRFVFYIGGWVLRREAGKILLCLTALCNITENQKLTMTNTSM